MGWWVVSPISHTLGHIIDQWRVVIEPNKNLLSLHYKGEVNEYHNDFDHYKDWVKENLGLETEIIKSDEVIDYSIYWKNKLVKVVTNE